MGADELLESAKEIINNIQPPSDAPFWSNEEARLWANELDEAIAAIQAKITEAYEKGRRDEQI